MKELKSEINLENNQIKFKSKSLGMKTAHDLTLKPGTTRDVKLYGLLPRTLHGKDLSLTVGKYLKPFTGSHIIVTIHRGTTYIRLHNNTSRTLKLKAHMHAAYIDISSLTDIYTHIKHVEKGYDSTVIYCQHQLNSINREDLYRDNSRKRVVSDMRFLNSRIKHLNIPFGLVRDAIQTIGESQSTVLSTIDLKDAFHSL